MRMLILLLASVLLFSPLTADRLQGLEAVAKALGATGLKSIEIQGGGTVFQVGQSLHGGHGLAAVQRAELHARGELRHGVAARRHPAHARARAAQGRRPVRARRAHGGRSSSAATTPGT